MVQFYTSNQDRLRAGLPDASGVWRKGAYSVFRGVRHSISNLMASLALVESFTLGGLCFAFVLVSQTEATVSLIHIGLLVSFCLGSLTVIVMAAFGLYEARAIDDLGSLMRRGAMAAIVLAGFGMLAVAYLFSSDLVAPLLGIAFTNWQALYFYSMAIASLFVIRVFFRHLGRTSILGARVVLVGPKEELSEIELKRVAYPGASFRIALQFSVDKLLHVVGGADVADGQCKPLYEILREAGASTIILTGSGVSLVSVPEILRCKLAGISITNSADFFERASGRVDLSQPKLESILLAPDGRSSWASELVLRLLDIALSAALLCSFLPLMLVAAIAIKLQDGGDVFYLQERVGLNGSKFLLRKFRSMIPNAENGNKPVWAEANDKRITPVGRVLRKFRIDELPQLLNVFWGDMSLVGPRPERPHFVNQLAYAVPHYHLRHSVKPGITGWAQVNFRYGASIEDARIKQSFDLYSIKHRGILLYLLVLLRTIRVVLWPGEVMAR